LLWGNILFQFPSLRETLDMWWRFLSIDLAFKISISKYTFELAVHNRSGFIED
jgi:hypothetical protein